MQVPPVYSALHIDGKRAYQEARKGNIVEMPSREIEVYSISLISYENGVAVVDCHVSKGTYIRALARDIALKCSSRAHLTALRRVSIGPWSLDDITKDTKTLLDMTGLLSTVVLSDKRRKFIDNGNIDKRDFVSDSDCAKQFAYLYFSDGLYGICEKGEKIKILSRIEDGIL